MSRNNDATTLHLRIISPERVLFDDEVYEVVLPTLQGEVGILPDHIPYLSGLKAGTIAIAAQKGQPPQPFCEINNGFIELNGSELSVLTSLVIEV